MGERRLYRPHVTAILVESQPGSAYTATDMIPAGSAHPNARMRPHPSFSPFMTGLFWAFVGLLSTKLLISVSVGFRKRSLGWKMVIEEATPLIGNPLMIDMAIAGVIALYFAANFSEFIKHRTVLLGFACLLALNVTTSLMNGINFLSGFTISTKLGLPMLAFLMLQSVAAAHPILFRKGAIFITGFIYALIVFGILALPGDYNRHQLWLPAYFSGVHTSSYVALAACFLFFGLKTADSRSARTGRLVVGAGTLLLVTLGWGIRTIFTAHVLFLLFFYYRTVRHLRPYVLGIFALAATLAVLYVTAENPTVSFEEMNRFSSGRIDMWLYKIEDLTDRTGAELLFGKGYGTDPAFSRTWWWGEKDSHNNYLRILGEYGFLYLILLMAVVIRLIRYDRRNYLYLAMWLAYLFTNLISNGFFTRPLAGYVFAFALAATLGNRLAAGADSNWRQRQHSSRLRGRPRHHPEAAALSLRSPPARGVVTLLRSLHN